MQVNVLSLFDGISCGQIALERAGINYCNYYASEIDKYAIQVTQTHYPDTVQLGDISKWIDWDLPKIDLIISGFPCQSWSLSGKQLGDKDERGKLFWVMLDVMAFVKSKNPNVKLLMENVKMKKEFEEYITSNINKTFPDIDKYLINSSLVSAQNRNRYYWTNIPNITQPEDKGILLKDIIETGYIDRDKSHCIDANYFKGGNLKSYFEKHRRQLVFSKDMLCHVGDADIKGNDSIKRVYSVEGKSPTLSTCQGGHREPKVLCGAWRGRYTINGIRQDAKMKTAGLTEQRLEVRLDEKTNTLTTVQKDNNIIDIDNMMWRKLTPLECERLQTVPENYTLVPYMNRMMSNSQRYKMLGNSFTVDVIAHIFKNIA